MENRRINRDLIVLKNGKLDKKIKERIVFYDILNKTGHMLISKVKNANKIDYKLRQNIFSFLEDVGYHISESDNGKLQTIFNSVIKENKNLNKHKVISLIRLCKLKVFQFFLKELICDF